MLSWKKLLDFIEKLAVDNWLMLSLKRLALVRDFSDVESIPEELVYLLSVANSLFVDRAKVMQIDLSLIERHRIEPTRAARLYVWSVAPQGPCRPGKVGFF